MANYFNLSTGIRNSKNGPIDGDRYIAATTTERDALIPLRAHNGLQVYVESEKTLYILDDINLHIWRKIGEYDIDSSDTQILFNSGGTLTGSSNLIYDYDSSSLKLESNNSIVQLTNSASEPSVLIKSNIIDGIAIDVANSSPNPYNAPIITTVKSKGNQSTRTNVIDDDLLFSQINAGYYNSTEHVAVSIGVTTREAWSLTSHATEYKISTSHSGTTTVSEKFRINELGNIVFNNQYSFPTTLGTQDQILKLNGSELNWSVDPNTTLTENIGIGGIHDITVGDITRENSIFINFMNTRISGATSIYQMGEIQILHDGTNIQLINRGQDIDLVVDFSVSISGNDIILTCDVPTDLSTQTTMSYTIKKI